MRATGFEIGPLEWRAAKGDIRFIGQVERPGKRMLRTGVYCWMQVRTLLISGVNALIHRRNLRSGLSVPEALPSHPPCAPVPSRSRLSKGSP